MESSVLAHARMAERVDASEDPVQAPKANRVFNRSVAHSGCAQLS